MGKNCAQHSTESDNVVRRLARHAVRAGALPNDPALAFSPTFPAERGCSLCGQPFGKVLATRLISADGMFVLHDQCFRAWADVVSEHVT